MKIRNGLILIAVICLGACNSKEEKKSRIPVRVSIETVSESTSSFEKNYVGEVEAQTSTAVSFTGSGTVTKVMVNSGQYVSKGQLIAVMDPTQCKNAVFGAEALLMQAEDAYERMKVLHERKSLSDMDWVEVQSKLAQAKSTVQSTQKMLSDCNLIAPCSGIIGKKMLESGQVALPSQPVCTILDISNVNIKVSIPEKEISNITKNTVSQISIASINQSFTGTSIEKEIEADKISRSYTIKIQVDNKRNLLLPGMVCDVMLDTSNQEKKNSSLSVPITAVQRSATGEMFVWKAQGGKSCRSSVTLGKSNGNRIEVNTGLKAGDKIIVKGFQKLSEGNEIIEIQDK